jgi:hypothetical protein
VPATLNLAAVGRVLGTFRPDGSGAPLTAKSVSIYIQESKPGGRYESHPFPQPAGRVGGGPGGGAPYWTADQVSAIEEWGRNRPGQGAGGGRPWTEESKAEIKAKRLHAQLAALSPVERKAFEEAAKPAKATGRSRKTS